MILMRIPMKVATHSGGKVATFSDSNLATLSVLKVATLARVSGIDLFICPGSKHI